MRLLIQRVESAQVEVEGRTVGSIGRGLLILLGITGEDGEAECEYLAEKAANLRIFTDSEDKMNLSLLDTGGEALVVSQFTLYGDCRKGRRPAFIAAARPEQAAAVPLFCAVFGAGGGLPHRDRGVWRPYAGEPCQ